MATSQPPLAKIIILGDSAVGKTSLIMRYTDDSFSGQYLTTLGFDYRRKEINVQGERLLLQIWDTAGQEQFRSITKSYMRGADGAALVFDVTSRDSFKRINTWMDSIADNAVKQIDVILIANKTDSQERAVTTDEIQKVAAEFGILYWEVSARTGENVADAFDQLGAVIATHLESSVQKTTPIEKSQCC